MTFSVTPSRAAALLATAALVALPLPVLGAPRHRAPTPPSPGDQAPPSKRSVHEPA